MTSRIPTTHQAELYTLVYLEQIFCSLSKLKLCMSYGLSHNHFTEDNLVNLPGSLDLYVIQFFVGRDHTYHVIYRSFSAVSLMVGRLLRCLDYVYV